MVGHTVSVTITNTTSRQIFSPPVVVAHSASYRPFALGKPALPELVPLAEDGRTRDFVTVARVEPSILDYAIAKAPLQPGQSVTLQVRIDRGHSLLSAFGMLVTTNDTVFYYGSDLAAADAGGSSAAMASAGGAGASSGMAGSGAEGASASGMASPAMSASAGSMQDGAMAGGGSAKASMAAHVDLYDGTVRTLDAGSEANTESCTDIPGPPCNSEGVRHRSMAEGLVTLSHGLAGKGDLDVATYGWHDPVATVRLATP